MTAPDSGGPTIGTQCGARPVTPRSASRSPFVIAPLISRGLADRAICASAIAPSIAGVMEIAPATRQSRAATATT
jgi:hypothetical protein